MQSRTNLTFKTLSKLVLIIDYINKSFDYILLYCNNFVIFK